MRLKNLIVGSAIVLLFAVVFIQTSKNVNAATKTLNIDGNVFSPPNQTIVVGDQILFENEDAVPHVLEIRRATDSGLIHTENFAAKTAETKDTYTRTFSVVGDYNLFLDTNVATGSVTVVQSSPSPSITSTPTASPTSSPTVSPSVSPSVSATASPTASPSLSPTPSSTVSPTPSPTIMPTQSASPTPTPSPTVSPTTSPSATPTVTPTVSPTPSPTVSPTATPTLSPTITPTSSPTPTVSPTVTPSPTVVPTATATPTMSPTPVPTVTSTPTSSPTPTVNASPTVSPTVAPTVTPTPTVPSAPLPAVLPGFSVFRATTCAAQINTGNTQVLTDKVTSVYMTRGYWNVTSVTPVNNGISLSAVLYQIQKINLFFGGNPFFGGNKVTLANEQATFVGAGVSEVLQKASAAWCLR